MMQVPRVALWLHEHSLPPDEREAVIGDLVEEFALRAAHDSRAARRWLWTQTCRSLAPNLRRRLRYSRSTMVADTPHGAAC